MRNETGTLTISLLRHVLDSWVKCFTHGISAKLPHSPQLQTHTHNHPERWKYLGNKSSALTNVHCEVCCHSGKGLPKSTQMVSISKLQLMMLAYRTQNCHLRKTKEKKNEIMVRLLKYIYVFGCIVFALLWNLHYCVFALLFGWIVFALLLDCGRKETDICQSLHCTFLTAGLVE